jgi:hypothetical protein
MIRGEQTMSRKNVVKVSRRALRGRAGLFPAGRGKEHLGPRLAHALLPIAGKRDSDWGYAAIPVAGPLIGAALAGLVVAAVGV